MGTSLDKIRKLSEEKRLAAGMTRGGETRSGDGKKTDAVKRRTCTAVAQKKKGAGLMRPATRRGWPGKGRCSKSSANLMMRRSAIATSGLTGQKCKQAAPNQLKFLSNLLR